MSAPDSKPPSNLPTPYRVGYKQPPAEHRFTKGQSGNPRGRPKGSVNKPKVDTGYGMKPTVEFLRMEAYRPVTIREGDEIIQLPAIQAVFRSMGVSAMKGNRFAQRTMAELVTRMEAEDKEARFELFSTALNYKEKWGREIERCQNTGQPVPDLVPHPDDIVIDPANGGVRILGPKTKEQKVHYDEVIARRTEAQENVSYYAAKHARARVPAMKECWLEEWHFEQRIFDILNEALAPRYQIKLENRSYHHDASVAGHTLAAFLEDRKLPLQKRKWGGYVED